MTHRKATLFGLGAILLWSTTLGQIRGVSETLGPVGGAAMMYTCASLLLLVTVGCPKISSFPRPYVYIGSLLFVGYEMLLTLALGYAHSGRQAIEVGMVNYLWPSLTILFAALFNRQKAGLLMIPGLTLALLGICRVLGGDQGLDAGAMVRNLQDNPLCYGMACAGALVWAAYCTVTTKMASGKNGITLFFTLTALGFWGVFLASDTPPLLFTAPALFHLTGAAVAMGFGYAAWNVGILHGNVPVLATASYFTPVLSVALAALLLRIPLLASFWQGALLVCAGSLVCWISLRRAGSRRVNR